MRRLVILLSAILLLTITCSSQNISIQTVPDSTVSITCKQLKYANLIFNEHSKLLKENNLLFQQIDELNHIITIYDEIDNNRKQQIIQYQNITSAYELQVQKLNKDIKRKKNTILGISIGGVTVTAGLLLFILLK